MSILPILLALAVVGHLVRERWMIMSASVSLVRLEFEVFGKVQGEQTARQNPVLKFDSFHGSSLRSLL